MRVLINNPHNSSFGGGELYTYQVAKAISEFADVDFLVEPNKNIYESNPDLKIENFGIFNSVGRKYEHFLDICHFKNIKCNLAENNTKVVFFPKAGIRPGKFETYDKYVSICDYTKKYVKKYWEKDSLVCRPYSANIKPRPKIPNTIVSIGNFFQEEDGQSKGFEYLIMALKDLPGFKLTLIGHVVNPDYVAYLRSLSKGVNLTILTDLPEYAKREILGESEFYWHANGFKRTDPAQTEHFGIAPEEALKAGCMTYVHQSGGAQEFCSAWDTLEKLVELTENRIDFPGLHSPSNFQTPVKMKEFWRETLS